MTLYCRRQLSKVGFEKSRDLNLDTIKLGLVITCLMEKLWSIFWSQKILLLHKVHGYNDAVAITNKYG